MEKIGNSIHMSKDQHSKQEKKVELVGKMILPIRKVFVINTCP
jgi:hypothetical protein